MKDKEQNQEPKKKRGRPPKDKAPETPKEPEKPVYSHESKIRCPHPSRAYPAFIQSKRCGAVMRAEKTTNGGSTKRWKCPKCGKFHRTEGKLI